MPQYDAGSLLASVMEEGIRAGYDASIIQTNFISDNSENGRFNPNKQIDLGGGITPAELARSYGTKAVQNSPGIANTKQRTSVSATTYPSGILDQVIQKGSDFILQGADLMKAISGEADAAVANSAVAEQAAAEVGAAKAAAIRAKGANDVTRLDYRQNLLAALGMDINDPTSQQRDMLTEANAAVETTRKLAPQLAKLRDVSFLDNPIAWVQAQLQLDGVSQKYNAAAQVANNNFQVVATQQQLAANGLALQPGVSRDALIAQNEADANEAVAAAKLDQFKIQGVARQTKLAAYSTELQYLGNVFTQGRQLASLLAERTQLSEYSATAGKEKTDMDMLNIWRVRMGMKPLTDFAQYKSLDAKERTKQLEYASRGALNIADTPGDSINALVDFQQFTTFTDSMSEAGKLFVMGYTRQAATQADTLQKTSPVKLTYNEAFKKAANTQYNTWRDELKSRDYSNLSPGNPFKMNAAVYAVAPQLKENPLAEYALAAPSAGQSLQVKDIMNFAISKVQAGTPVAEVAKQVKEFFYYGSKQQAQEYRLADLGFDLKPPGGDRMGMVVNGNMFGIFDRFMDPRLTNRSNRDVQLFDEPDVTNFLILNTVKSGYANSNTGVRDVINQIQTDTSNGPGGISGGLPR